MVDITGLLPPHHRTFKPGDSVVCIPQRGLPAPFLQPRASLWHTSTLFSATLQPARYYADLLGLPVIMWVDVESPPLPSTSCKCRWRATSPRVTRTARHRWRPSRR